MINKFQLKEKPCGCKSDSYSEMIGTEWEGEINRRSPNYINWVQRSLNQIMGLRLAVDGKLGTQTRSAIRSFQGKNGLLPDGIVGRRTKAALIAARKGQPSQAQDKASEFEVFDFRADDSEWESEINTGRGKYIQWVQRSLWEILGPEKIKAIYKRRGRAQPKKIEEFADGDLGKATSDAIELFHSQQGLQSPQGLEELNPQSRKNPRGGIICHDTELALTDAGATDPPGIDVARLPETTPPGRTSYVDIPSLQVPVGQAKSMTGIFVPENYCLKSKFVLWEGSVAEVDLIVYLHGNKNIHPSRFHHPKHSIDTYWSQRAFSLREEVNKSQKNVILVAPTLGEFNQPGSLTCPGGFNKFLDQVMEALEKYGPYKGTGITPTIGNIILACHSGSWWVMGLIAMGSDSYAAHIKECWAFDPSGMPDRWGNWAQSNRKLYIYSGPSGAGRKFCKDHMGRDMPKSGMVSCAQNIFGELTTKNHDEIPRDFLKDRIRGAPFLVDKSPCQTSGTRQSISPTRQISSWFQGIPFELSNESAGMGLPNNYWGEDVWQEEVPRTSPDYNKWVQQSLNQIMGLRLSVDGKMGAQTRSAIRSFQQKHGLAVDGKVGLNTEAAIKAAQAGAPAKPTLFQYVKDFSGPTAECTNALNNAGKTKAEALEIINAQIGLAIVMLRKAAADLKRGNRSSTTSDLFLKIFRVRPQFVPTWLKQTATIKDRGDVVATRCSRVADLLASGKINFFCTINSTNCPDCTRPPTNRTHACSSYGNDRVICLGPAFWNAMKAGNTDSLLATLIHEPFHIYYGIYVTQHERRRPDGTLESVGKFGGINCIVQFVFETNGRAAPQRVNDRCAKTAVRKELELV